MKAAALLATLALGACAAVPSDGRYTRASPVPQLDTSTCPVLHPSYGVRPIYPGSMLRDRKEGWVLVGFDVDPEGAPNHVRVLKSDPGGAFDAEAMRVMARARFPANQPHSGCQISMEFHLPG